MVSVAKSFQPEFVDDQRNMVELDFGGKLGHAHQVVEETVKRRRFWTICPTSRFHLSTDFQFD